MKGEIVFLIFLAFTELKGFKFPHENNIIVLTARYPKGVIGKVTIDDDSKVIYVISASTPLIKIDEDTGELTLLKDMDKSNTAKFNKTKLTIKATTLDQLQTKTTTINIILLPRYFGDQFGRKVMEVVKTCAKKNHVINTSTGEFIHITADFLDRSLKYISGKDVSISLAKTRLEKAIALTKTIIVKLFEKKLGDNAVFGFFHIKELFSSAVMTKLDRESSCSESTVSDSTTCSLKSVFRSIDGKCNNLNRPNMGAAGTEFTRVLPALYFDPDGLNDPNGFPNQPNAPYVPSPFKISKDFIKDEVASSASPELTPAVMQLGQFLDHDLALTGGSEGSKECENVRCDGSPSDFQPPCYPILPLSNGQPPCIRFVRSAAVCQAEGYPMKREQLNEVTALIDGSQIYGSSRDSAQSLRETTRQQTYTHSWSKISGKLKQIDNGLTTQVWGVNVLDYIYRLKPDKKWQRISGRLKHVSPGQAGVWGVNVHDDIYFRVGITSSNPAGSSWKKISGSLKQIDSGSSMIVYGVNSEDHVFCRAGINKQCPFGTHWLKLEGTLKYVSCGTFGCWGVKKNYNIYFRLGVSKNNCVGSSWKKISGSLMQIEVGAHGDVYGIHRNGKVYRRVGVTKSVPFGTGWEKIWNYASHVTTGLNGQYILVHNNIYESSDDQGLLRVSKGNRLPLDETSDAAYMRANTCVVGCFVAGDIRANEHQGLASFQTLFLREHNRVAKELKVINNHWNGERIYQETRKIIGAVLQKIVYEDYLPLILGPGAIPSYTEYDENVNISISNSFATGAYRFGHSTIRSTFDLLDPNFDPIASAVKLRFLFFNNTIINKYGIEPVLLGLVGNASQKVDRILTKEITDHLFERTNEPGREDLAALNIQRSRDHGLPGYNEFRKFCGLSDAKTFEDTKKEIKNLENRIILKRLYKNDPNLVELWVAGLAETPVSAGAVGPTFKCIIADQFRRTRDGDRFFYKRKGVFLKNQLEEIEKASLSSIYCDNVENIVSIQKNAFKTPTEGNRRTSCERISRIDFRAWKEPQTYTHTWSQISGKLKQIDNGLTTQVWGVNVLDYIYRLKPDKKWQRISGRLKHVSPGEAGVWGVNAHDNIYFRVGITSSNPAGGTWKKIRGSLKQIDSGSSDMVYGVNRKDQIYCRVGINKKNPSGTRWRRVRGALKYVSCGTFGCWGVNKNDNIYFRFVVSKYDCVGSSWKKISGSLMQIEVGAHGDVYGINRNGNVYRRVGVTKSVPHGTGWEKIFNYASHVTTGLNGQYILVHGDIYESPGQQTCTHAWSPISGKLKQIDNGLTTQVWGVNVQDYIYRLKPDKKWQRIFGRLKHVSPGEAGVWGVNLRDNIYFRVGITSSNPAGSTWKRIPGRLKQIDSGSSDIVYGVNRKDQIYCRAGINKKNPSGTSWRRVKGALKYVSCGTFGCWGVNKKDYIYFRFGVSKYNCVGSSWKKISGSLMQIEVGAHGDVYGIYRNGKVYRRVGVTKSVPFGTGWEKIWNYASHVTTGLNGQYILVRGNIYESPGRRVLLCARIFLVLIMFYFF